MNNRVTESAANIRGIARSALNGNWKQICIGMVLYVIIVTIVTDILTAAFPNYIVNEFLEEPVSMPIIPYLYYGIIIGPMQLGIISFVMHFFRRRDINPGYIFNGFGHFLKAFGTMLMIGLLSFWPFIVIYIGMILYTVSMASAALTSGVVPVTFALSAFVFVLLIIAAAIFAYIKMLGYSQSFYLLCNDLMDDNLTTKRGVMSCIKESKNLMKGNKGKIFCVRISYIGWAILSSLPLAIVSAILESMGAGTVVSLIFNSIATLPLAGYMAYSQLGDMVFHDILIGKLVARPAQPQIDQNM